MRVERSAVYVRIHPSITFALVALLAQLLRPHLPLQLSVQRCDNLTLTSNDVSVAWCMAVISSERYYYVWTPSSLCLV